MSIVVDHTSYLPDYDQETCPVSVDESDSDADTNAPTSTNPSWLIFCVNEMQQGGALYLAPGKKFRCFVGLHVRGAEMKL